MKKILIVQACFYEDISEMLLKGAIAEISSRDIEYEVIDVVGALEIAPAIAMAAKTKEYDGYVALGCVIRGETSHYDIVAVESARELLSLSTKKRLAIGNGIITVENRDQALARADQAQKNKGGFAAKACLVMMGLKQKFAKK